MDELPTEIFLHHRHPRTSDSIQAPAIPNAERRGGKSTGLDIQFQRP